MIQLVIDLLIQIKGCVRHQSEPIFITWDYSLDEDWEEHEVLEALQYAIEILRQSKVEI